MLGRLVDVRRGEWKRALLAFGSLLLVIGSYTVVKSVRDALFLSKFGITQLSLIAIGLAVATGFIISIYLRATSGVSRNWLIGGTNAVVAGSLVVIWAGLLSPTLARVLPWVLYIWSSVFGVFMVMQFWLLANDLFDAREGKRLFGFVGGGAILGGILGGALSRTMAGVLGSSNLLLVAAAMLILEVVLVFMVWPLRRREEELVSRPGRPTPRVGGGLGALGQSRVVRLLAAALLVSTMATTLLDWQFKGIAKAAYAGRTDEMAGFFGALYAYLSVASFLVQTLLTGGILRRFGVSVGLMALPVSLFAGSGLILASVVIPGISRLFAASGAKIAEGGLRFSLDKASMELMWLPVPRNIKEKGKAFVDTVVDRLGTGLTGFVWLGLALFGLDTPARIHLISIAVGVLVMVWLAVLVNARGAYVGALRAVLARRSLDTSGVGMLNAEARRSIEETLGSEDRREVCFALYVLEDLPGDLPAMAGPLAHPDAAVRVEALRLLARRRDPRHRAGAVPSLSHESPAVRQAAVIYLRCTAPGGGDPLLQEIEAGGQVDRAELNVIRLGQPSQAMAAASELRQMLADAEPERRSAVLRVLGGAPPELAAALLAAYLGDPDTGVAVAALSAAGHSRAAGLSEDLCRLLADRRLRRPAAEALAMIGPEAVPSLVSFAGDEGQPSLARERAVQLLGASGQTRPEVVSLLLGLVEADDPPPVAHRALRGLNRLRSNARLVLEEDQLSRVWGRIDEELLALYRELCFLGMGSWADLREAGRPEFAWGLERTIAERADRRVERLFRLLALTSAPRDIYNAYLGVRSPIKSVRASSIELLDNLLPKPVSARLLPVLESSAGDRFFAAAKAVGVQGPEPRLALMRRVLGEDARQEPLRLVAAWTAGVERIGELRGELSTLSGSGGEGGAGRGMDVAIEADRALHRLDEESFEEPTMGLTTIEKALKLQKADVLQQASTEDLAHIAQIATEEELEPGASIYGEGDAPDALFVVLSGRVRLQKGETVVAELGANETFGGWALVDESPRVASAVAVEQTTVLRVGREDFQELLADRVDIVQAVFKAMVDRLRNLADLASNS